MVKRSERYPGKGGVSGRDQKILPLVYNGPTDIFLSLKQ